MAQQNPEDIALVDLDGTLANFDDAMQHELERMRGPGEPSWQRGPDEAPPHMEARMEAVKARQGFWSGLQPIPVGFSVLRQIHNAGYRVNILTKASYKHTNSWSEKVEWVKKYVATDYPNVQVTITQDKGLSYGKVLFDDWPSYITRWLRWRPRGLVLMPNQPWNQAFYHPNVLRITGTQENMVQVSAALERRKAGHVCTCVKGNDEYTPDSTNGCLLHSEPA